MAGSVSKRESLAIAYLSDEILRKLDAEVESRAAMDRASGLEGRAITNRSKLIESILREHLDADRTLPRETIEYWACRLGEEFGAQRISLFGSYARGEADAASDVDILLDKGEIRGMAVLDFQDALAEKLGRPVDVVTTAGASERFLGKIQREAVTLYEAS